MGIIKILESGGDNDPDMGIFSGHDIAEFHPVHVGHFDIGKQDIGELFFHDCKGVLPGDGLRDDLHMQGTPVGAGEQHLAGQFFIVHNKDFQHFMIHLISPFCSVHK